MDPRWQCRGWGVLGYISLDRSSVQVCGDLVCLSAVSSHTAWCDCESDMYLWGMCTSAAIARGRRPWKFPGRRSLAPWRNRPVTAMGSFRCCREPQMTVRETGLGGGFRGRNPDLWSISNLGLSLTVTAHGPPGPESNSYTGGLGVWQPPSDTRSGGLAVTFSSLCK